MSGRGSGSGINGGVTLTSMPNSSMDTIQKFVGQFGTGMSVSEMANKVYNALPVVGSSTAMGGTVADKGAAILNDRYLEMSNGTIYQFVKQKSQGTWKVKKLK